LLKIDFITVYVSLLLKNNVNFSNMDCIICYQKREVTEMAKYEHIKNKVCNPNICYSCANNWYEKSYSCPNCRDFVINIKKMEIKMDLSLHILMFFCSFFTCIVNNVLKYIFSEKLPNTYENVSYYLGVLSYFNLISVDNIKNELREDLNSFLIFKIYITLLIFMSLVLFPTSTKYEFESYSMIFILLAEIFYIFHFLINYNKFIRIICIFYCNIIKTILTNL